MSAPIKNNCRRIRPAMFGSALCCLFAGCAVGPDFARPDAPGIDHYIHGGDPASTPKASGTVQRFIPGWKVTDAWWQAFRSEKLNAIVAESLKRNPGLEAAKESLHAAQDNLRSGYGVFFPQVGTNFGATRQKFSPLKFGENVPASLFNLFSLSGTIGYTLDVFGGNRRMVESLGAERDIQAANERAAYVTLASNVVNAVIARAAYQEEIKATRELIEIEKQQVALSKVQFEAGTVAYSSILGIEAQLETYEASLPQLEQNVAQADNLLATLAGHAPAEWRAPDAEFAELSLPHDLPVRLPSELVRQRPDILAAEAVAHDASAQIGVATAAMLPNITLSGSYGQNATAMNSLLDAKGNVWSLGVGVAQPLFEGGTLWFRRQSTIDTYKQSMALYHQTVLNAFGEVANTLSALDHDAETLATREDALTTAKEALHLVQSNYNAGLANYLAVIVANDQYHEAQVSKLEAVAARYQDTVALFVAIGGGWEGESEPASSRGGDIHADLHHVLASPRNDTAER